MLSKGQSYGNEDTFDLTLKTRDELVVAFRNQGVLTEEEIETAINNTNVLDDMIESFELDYSFKYPTDYQDEFKEMNDRISVALNDIPDELIETYVSRVEEEIESFSKVGMVGFMLYMADIGDFCKSEGIPYGPGRGSCTGSLVAYLLGITDVDPIIWQTNFARFVNDSRISLGDIDVDFSPEDRAKVYAYIRNRSTDSKSCYIGTFGKLSTKSIIDNVSRALNKNLEEVAEIKRGYAEIEKREGILDRKYENGGCSEREYEEEKAVLEKEMSEYISKFDDIFYYYKGLKGVIITAGIHACGFVGSPIDVRKNIGLRYDKKQDKWISQCDMKAIDSVNFVKFDVLSLKTLQVIKHTYKLLDKPIPRASEIDWNDRDVFNSMATSPVGLFQMESSSSFGHLRNFNPTRLTEISLLNALVRPSCDSFRQEAIERLYHENPSEEINTLFKDSFGYLVYQEQIISFLQEICGFTGQEADNVRRFIGKKDMVSLEAWIPKIEQGYVDNSSKDEDVAREECQQFMQVLKDAGSYSFSYNHSLAYSMLTYHTAYLRYYHPVEFITAYLNNASNDDDIVNGTEFAKLKGIEIKNPTFGMSRGKYSIADGIVYKGVGSVLNVSDVCANDLYDIYPEVSNKGITEVLEACMTLRSTDTRKIRTLIRINYFNRYGMSGKLDRFFDYFEKYRGKKQIKKDGIPAGTERIILKMLEKGEDGFAETKSLYKYDYKILLDEIFKCIKDVELSDMEKLKYELSYLGYVQSNLDISYGIVRFYSHKNSSYGVEDSASGKLKWFKLIEGLSPLEKNEIIVFSDNTKGWITGYTRIELDRNKK
ncbi:MAG: hypothetical protein ACRCX2_12490, partial [Paraclostridium sp.]